MLFKQNKITKYTSDQINYETKKNFVYNKGIFLLSMYTL